MRNQWRVALAVILAMCAFGCTDDDGSAAPVAGASTENSSAPGISVTRTVTEHVAADTATVVVVLEVPFDQFEAPPLVDEAVIRSALESSGFAPDAVRVEGSPDFGLEVLVDVAPERLPQIGADVVGVVEAATEIEVLDSGVLFGVGECADLRAELRARAVREAREEAELLADAAAVRMGPIVGVSDGLGLGSFGFPSLGASDDAKGAGCPEAIGALDLLESIGSFGSSSGYQPFDAAQEAVVSVSLTVTFAVGDSTAAGGAPAAALSVLGRATVEGDADDAYVVAYIDPLPHDEIDELEEDLVRELAEFGALDGDVRLEQGYEAVLQVRLDPRAIADDGARISDVIESLVPDVYDIGVWYAAEACPDILEEARAAAFADAEQQAGSLAAASNVTIGRPIVVSDASFDYLSIPPQRCELLPADAADDTYPIDLAGFDDAPRLELEVLLEVSFAITE